MDEIHNWTNFLRIYIKGGKSIKKLTCSLQLLDFVLQEHADHYFRVGLKVNHLHVQTLSKFTDLSSKFTALAKADSLEFSSTARCFSPVSSAMLENTSQT